MTHLIRIGNSQGIRIPKPFIEQAALEGKELKLRIVEGGLLITPEREVRAGWQAAFEQSVETHGVESPDDAWLNVPLDADDELDW